LPETFHGKSVFATGCHRSSTTSTLLERESTSWLRKEMWIPANLEAVDSNGTVSPRGVRRRETSYDICCAAALESSAANGLAAAFLALS
jgi:hypothetical protein